MYTKLLFAYPYRFHNDISLYSEIYEDRIFYSIYIEGYIYYKTLLEGIEYLKELKDKYYEWLSKNYSIINLSEPDNKTLLYKTYDVEVRKEENEEVLIFLNAPKFSEILDTYRWFEGVIKQLEQINLLI